MFLKFLKRKKDKGAEKNEKDSLHAKEEVRVLQKDLTRSSSPVSMPNTPSKVHGQRFTRAGRFSTSLASSRSSVASSGLADSVSSHRSINSLKSQKSATYDIDRFSGRTSLPKKMKSTGYQDVWAQAYAFGGR